ncbi:hypothetical protein BASA81_000987 [Batrachochytrium salamandrivorans]|nr:hypothetical protein BASA81_000987 [Batrachochytrium salamandrivorans]
MVVMMGCWLVEATCPSLPSNMAICTSPSDCNSAGDCVRGVCRCNSGRVGETCATPDRWLEFGNVVVTQPGLDFAPIQYFSPIQRAFDNAKANGMLNIQGYDQACTNVDGDTTKSYKVAVKPITPDMFTKALLVPSSVKFTITSTGVYATATCEFVISKAKLDLYGGVGCCPCSGSDCTTTFCPHVCSSTNVGDFIDFSFTAIVGAKVDFTYSVAAQGLVATVGAVDLTFNDDSLGATLTCPKSAINIISNMVRSYFEQMKSVIAPTLKPMMQQELTLIANRIASRYQGVQEFTPFDGVYVLYRVINLTVTNNKWISVDVQAKLLYEQFSNLTLDRTCYINTTYADTSSDYLLLPNRVWGPIVKWLDPSGLVSPILAGIRMSRSFFNAMTWAVFQQEGRRVMSFTYTQPGTALAAVGQTTISVPYFKIPSDSNNRVLKAALNGQAQFSCPPTQTGSVLSLTYTGLECSFMLTYDDTPPNPSIQYQLQPNQFSVSGVSAITSLEPKLVNQTLLKSAMVGAMNFNLDTMTQYLLQKGKGVLVLPPDMQTLFPDAQLNIISQAGIPNESGYIEMINRCACSSSLTPITGQKIDGTVQVCPRALLNNNYCRDLVMRRRLNDEGVQRRELSTPQQDADLVTVLGLVGAKCITRAPTLVPTLPSPTVTPTLLPTRSPTVPSIAVDYNDSPCQNNATCEYKRDVLFFVCEEGQQELLKCRRGNSDIYCCNLPGYVKPSSASLGAVHSSLLVLLVIALTT